MPLSFDPRIHNCTLCQAPGVSAVMLGTPQVITEGKAVLLADDDDLLFAVCVESLESGDPSRSRAMARLYAPDAFVEGFDADRYDAALLAVFEALRSAYLEDPSRLQPVV